MIWFSLYDHNEYKSSEMPFVDVISYDGISDLQANWKLVFNEFKSYANVNEIEAHFNSVMVEKPKTWKVRSLRVWDVEMYDVQRHFPETMKIINNIPNVVNVGFNILDAKAKIKPHNGDTNAIIRCHLGLQIPKENTFCGLKVKHKVEFWEEGKVFGFEDAFIHEAWNDTDEIRIILLFDILKPQFMKYRRRVCATIILSLYIQRIANVFTGLYKVNRIFLKCLLFPLILFLQIAIPLRNNIKKRSL